MFVELAALVHLQGEMIEDIDENISTAKANVLTGEQDLIAAKKNMNAARKVKYFLLLQF